MPQTSLRTLNQFAQRKAKLITNTPVKVELGNLPQKQKSGTHKYNVVSRGYTETFYPKDKTQKPTAVRHGVIIDRRYYQQNRNNPYELRQTVIHELCHSQVPHSHGEQFRKCARKLGADKAHQGQYWS